MKSKVFISHAVADKCIAGEFTRLLASGLNITGTDVFCSSLPGRTIPGGFNFVDHIKDALDSSKVVLLLLTENYFASQFCLAEIGACWISKENVVPILVPPVGYEKLEATLSITQAWKINDDDALNSIADDICKPLKLEVSKAQWGVEKKVFLEKINLLIKGQDAPVFISPDEYEDCKKQLEYCSGKIEKLEGELEKKQHLIEEIKKLKDESEVNELEMAHMDEFKKFEVLCEKTQKAISSLPSVVKEAIYYDNKDEILPAPDHLDKYEWEKIRHAANSNMLNFVEGEPIELNSGHPKVSKACNIINELKGFMSEHEETMGKLIEDKYEVTFDLADQDFWEEFIG